MDLAGKRITVMGLGRFGGGIGVTRWLCSQGADVLVTDKDPAEDLCDSGPRHGHVLRQAVVIVSSTPSAIRAGRSPMPRTSAGSSRGSTSMTFVSAATKTP